MMEWIRFGIAALLFAGGLVVLFLAIFGTFRLKYSLNEMHSAAMCDTLALMLFTAACVVISGFNAVSLKILLAAGVIWLTSPVVSHVFVKAKYMTDDTLSEYCDIQIDKKEEAGPEAGREEKEETGK